MRVLVVDDDRFLGEYITRELSAHGHEATYLQSATRAMATVAQERFDLLVCDLVMPGMNGLHVVRSVRQRLPNLPIIVFSSLPPTQWETKCLEAGATRYLQKPIPIDVLLEEVSLVDSTRLRLRIGIIDFDPEHRSRLHRDLDTLGCEVRAWASLPEMVREYPHGPEGLTLLLVDASCRDVITALGWAKEYHLPTVAFGSEGPHQHNMLRLGASLCVSKPVDASGLITQARFLVG